MFILRERPEFILWALTAATVIYMKHDQLVSVLSALVFSGAVALTIATHRVMKRLDRLDWVKQQAEKHPTKESQQWYKWRIYDRKQLALYWSGSFILGALFIVLKPFGFYQTLLITLLNPLLSTLVTVRYVITGRATFGSDEASLEDDYTVRMMPEEYVTRPREEVFGYANPEDEYKIKED